MKSGEIRVERGKLTYNSLSSWGKCYFQKKTATSLHSILSALFFFLFFILLSSCGTDSRHFKIDGRFLHLNQGEFYVYSPDGVISGIDTIRVEAGRFRYEVECEQEGTLIMVFPNFSEQPIFVKPGESVDIKGDASHLKEMTVTGTDDNELMNAFRKHIVNASPPEIKKTAQQFIEDNPTSIICTYLLSRYFLQSPYTDYQLAATIANKISKQQPENVFLERLAVQANSLKNSVNGKPLPIVSAKDVHGNSVSTATLKDAETGVVILWASWNHDSVNMLRMLKNYSRRNSGLKIFTVCVDPGRDECMRTVERDSISYPVVCDERMLESPLLNKLGLSTVPDVVITKKGRIVEHGLSYDELRQELEKL